MIRLNKPTVFGEKNKKKSVAATMSAPKAPKGKVQQNVVLSPEVAGGDVVSLKESKTQVSLDEKKI
jgi:hypothetical protein